MEWQQEYVCVFQNSEELSLPSAGGLSEGVKEENVEMKVRTSHRAWKLPS